VFSCFSTFLFPEEVAHFEKSASASSIMECGNILTGCFGIIGWQLPQAIKPKL
jgi:hypothetical protein